MLSRSIARRMLCSFSGAAVRIPVLVENYHHTASKRRACHAATWVQYDQRGLRHSRSKAARAGPESYQAVPGDILVAPWRRDKLPGTVESRIEDVSDRNEV